MKTPALTAYLLATTALLAARAAARITPREIPTFDVYDCEPATLRSETLSRVRVAIEVSQ